MPGGTHRVVGMVRASGGYAAFLLRCCGSRCVVGAATTVASGRGERGGMSCELHSVPHIAADEETSHMWIITRTEPHSHTGRIATTKEEAHRIARMWSLAEYDAQRGEAENEEETTDRIGDCECAVTDTGRFFIYIGDVEIAAFPAD